MQYFGIDWPSLHAKCVCGSVRGGRNGVKQAVSSLKTDSAMSVLDIRQTYRPCRLEVEKVYVTFVQPADPEDHELHEYRTKCVLEQESGLVSR